MNKRMNTVFFSICFLAALMAETYCIQILKDDLLSVVGIGVVVLLTGYLLLGSIRDSWNKSSEKTKFVLDKIYQEETQKWDERYTELINLQKATYTATKKNTAMLQEQLENIVSRLEAFEKSNEKAMFKMTELQKKSLEGQKNALNLEINYNKENTKQLIKVLREESDKLNQKEQLKLILELLENNNERGFYQEPKKAFNEPTESNVIPLYEEPKESNVIPLYDKQEESNVIPLYDEPKESKVIPLYDDPNKALTPDEIANLFASFGK